MKQARRLATAAGIAVFVALAALATASLVVLTGPAGAQFSDAPPWAADQINWLADNGIAEGYPDGTFRPDNNITRAQAAFWFGRYNSSISLVHTEVTSPGSSSAFIHTTTCPPGRRAVGGGGRTSASNTFITDSYPSSDTANATGWKVRWETEDNTSVNPGFVRVYALCAPETIPN
jgi:hypothetical protein